MGIRTHGREGTPEIASPSEADAAVALPSPRGRGIRPGSLTLFQRTAGNAATARLLRKTTDEAVRPAISTSKARRYNRKKRYSRALVERIEAAIGAPVDGRLGRGDAEVIADWQFAHGLTADGMVGPKTIGRLGLHEQPDEQPESAAPEVSIDLPDAGSALGSGVHEPEPEPAPEPEPVEAEPEIPATVADEAIPAMAPEGTGDFSAAVSAATEGAATAKGHKARTDALTKSARKYTKLYPELVKRYVAQAEPDDNEKVRVLGEASVAIARMEMLLGTIYHKGGSWETKWNKGHMVDHFTGGDAGPWCTLFATSAIQALVGGKKLKTASGYKVGNAEEQGLNLDYSEDKGGAFYGTKSSRNANAREGSSNFNIWQKLEGELEDLEGEARKAHAENFLTETFRPQAGDLLIMTRGGASTGSFTKGKKNKEGKLKKAFKSHTLMIERVSGLEMSVVEGNLGGKATGRTFNLSDPAHVGQIIMIARPSLETYGAGGAPDSELGGGEVTENDLKAPIAFVNTQLLEVAKDGGWVKEGSKATDVVADIVKGKAGTDAG